MRPEQKVEARLLARVRDAGGICEKLHPIRAGLPDRLVLLPGGRVHLVELKAQGGRLRAVQRVFIERAAKRGVEVLVFRSEQEVDKWADTL